MKGLSFWQWLGLIIIILVIGGVVFRLVYGKALINAVTANSDEPATFKAIPKTFRFDTSTPALKSF